MAKISGLPRNAGVPKPRPRPNAFSLLHLAANSMLMTHYLYEILAAALALLTLPLIVELAILTIASRLPRRGRMSSAVSTPIHLAVIIPAHNEEDLIGSCIESLQMSAAGDPTRIIAIAHNCSDRTAERAAQAGAEVVVYDDPQAKGKGCALAHGFAHASSRGMDASLIVDADSTVSPNLIAACAFPALAARS